MIVLRSVSVPEIPQPSYSAPAVVQRQAGITVLFTGSDGSTWDLTNGPVRLQPGVGGLVPSDVEHRWSESPILAGATHRGYREAARTFPVPVFAQSTPGLPFRDLDAMFWRALTPDAACLLTVVSPDAEVRTLPVRFVGVGEFSLDRDPLVMGHQAYPLVFTAPNPYWQGAAVSETFTPLVNPPTAFEPRGGVINLVPNQSTANSRVRNDGDVPAWPVYAITGPVASFSVGVGDNAIAYGQVAEGETIWIDTNPVRQTVGFFRGDNDENAWLGLTKRKFAQIPAGEEVPIDVVLTTPGPDAALTVELTPHLRRPW